MQFIPLPVPGKHYEIDRWADLQTSNREQHAKPALDAFFKTAEQVIYCTTLLACRIQHVLGCSFKLPRGGTWSVSPLTAS